MRHIRSVLLSIALLSLGWSTQALAFGVGIEGGVTGTFVSYPSTAVSTSSISNAAGGAAVGIIVEEEFDLPLLFLDLWADGQTPTLRLQTGGSSTAQYLPFDLGLRAGLGLGLFHPYVGLLGQLAFPTDGGGGPALNSPLLGIGADAGLDIAVFIFRFGVELRGVDVISTITSASGGPTGAYELQGLASARLSF